MTRATRWSIGGNRGVALVEFALLAPIFLLLLLGGLEICHTMYVRSVLVGQLQKAARDLSLEGASSTEQQSAIAMSVQAAVKNVIPQAVVTVVPKSYHDYANVANPAEEYNDADHDGLCDHGETFVDSNRNGHWDADGGVDNRGSAKDVVLLTATAVYDRLPLGRMFYADPQITLVARTLIRNQPNDAQADPPSGTCP